MPLDMQGKMLRLLQENEYTPVGGSAPSKARCVTKRAG
jgi:transcriptional regulator with PAS, ATPase and Fis domain